MVMLERLRLGVDLTDQGAQLGYTDFFTKLALVVFLMVSNLTIFVAEEVVLIQRI
jgi:hypothetical protein